MMENLNDYELIHLAREHNEDAFLMLHEKYLPIIVNKCKRIAPYMQRRGIESADLIQEGMVALEEAIDNFNPEDEATFYTYVNVCIDNHLFSQVRNMSTSKHRILNEAIPLEKMENDDGGVNLIYFIQDNRSNPEQGIVCAETMQELKQLIMDNLTKMEKCVLELKLQDLSSQEIGLILNKDIKSVYNTLQRIRLKVRAILDEEDR